MSLIPTNLINQPQKMLNLIAQRQEALGDNIANMHTIGYRRKDVDFSQYLNNSQKASTLEARTIEKYGPAPIESAPIRQSEIEQYKGLLYHGVPVSAILQAYSICQIQPNPGFSDDNNYLKNAIAEVEHVDFRKGLEKQTVITADGKDITAVVEKAVMWLTEHSF